MRRKKIIELLSLLFIVLFVYAAVSKLLEFQKFSVQLGQSPMLTNFAGTLAWFVPVVELIISMLLIFERTRLAGMCGSFCLMIVFTGYIILASRFSDYTPCSCGGIISGMNWNEHLVFNIFFVGVAIVGVVLEFDPWEVVSKE